MSIAERVSARDGLCRAKHNHGLDLGRCFCMWSKIVELSLGAP
jgi:hypothetical protein